MCQHPYLSGQMASVDRWLGAVQKARLGERSEEKVHLLTSFLETAMGPAQECVRTAKCSLSQLFLETVTGRCGHTPLPFVTQRLEEVTEPVAAPRNDLRDT